MNPKMNWGSWIVVSFILFALGTFFMVFVSMSTNVDLVTDDYYERELKYQNHIDMVKNTNTLEQHVEMEYAATSLQIKYPIKNITNITGTIYFFRPSDKGEDFSRQIEVDSSHSQSIPLSILSKGLWRAKISWVAGNHQYYSEIPIIIQ